MTDKPQQEQQTESAIKVRQVTDVHADFDAGGPAEPGQFYFQFILDDGAEEYVMQLTADDGRLVMQMISEAESLFLDTERGRLKFSDLD